MQVIRSGVMTASLLVVFLSLAGCGREEPVPIAEDLKQPEVYGSKIKSEVVDLLNQAKKNAARTGKFAAQVSELVEDYEKRPVGDHAAKYKGLRDGAQDLQRLAESSSPDVKKKIDELIALAESLPGDLKPVGETAPPKSTDIDR